MVFEGLKLLKKISSNQELVTMEMEGFVRGEQRGKTMDVPLDILINSLNKQIIEFNIAYKDCCNFPNDSDTQPSIQELKRCLVDIRNVAGCVFLKLQEVEQK